MIMNTMNSVFARKMPMCSKTRDDLTGSRRLIQARHRQRPAAEEQGRHHRRRHGHVRVFAHENSANFIELYSTL